MFSLTSEDSEEPSRIEPADLLDPEVVFERRWAMLIIEHAFARLRAQYESAGHVAAYDVLKPFLTSDSDSLHGHDAAEQLGITEPAMRMAVHRLRNRFAAALRAEVSQTVDNAQEVDAEIRRLLSIVSR